MSYYLNDGLGSRDLENLASPLRAIGQLEVDDLGEFGVLDIVQDDQGPVDTRHCKRHMVKLHTGWVDFEWNKTAMFSTFKCAQWGS